LVPSRQFIVTRQLPSTYRDWQKTRHPDTDANSIKPPGRYA
jgi:surfactin synthase thioesterase subunit